ncbi:MAG TPA: hypothetical protein VI795_02585 [Patescibacteria group bacterium]|nr:hypothetical protein [Patescibacteria group bacterium]
MVKLDVQGRRSKGALMGYGQYTKTAVLLGKCVLVARTMLFVLCAGMMNIVVMVIRWKSVVILNGSSSIIVVAIRVV